MENKNCGHCLYQGDIKERKVLCLIDNQRHPTSDVCQHWTDFIYGTGLKDRMNLALKYKEELAIIKREEAQRKYQNEKDKDDRNFQLQRDKQERAFQKKLFVWQFFTGLISGIIIAIVVQIILKLP